MAGGSARASSGKAEQFLTASFELRPSRRKAAMLERRRKTYEQAFYDVLAMHEAAMSAAVGAESAKRKAAISAIERDAVREGSASGLNEPLAHGLARELKAQAASYLELKRSGAAARWPRRPEEVGEGDKLLSEALDRLASSTTRDEENAARDVLLQVWRPSPRRPMTLARSRDVRILRKDGGALVALLNIARAKDADAREVVIEEGFDAATGEAAARKTTKTAILVPISCSKWHEHKLLSGGAELRSAVLLRRGDRWFLNAQFAIAVSERKARTFLGIDRGIVNLASGAVVDGAGAIVDALPLAGNEVAGAMRSAERKARIYQRRTARSIPLHRRRSHHLLHELANDIVREAKGRQAQVVVESLSGLKETITAKRDTGHRKGGWRKHLKRAQLGKLEEMLNYKLRLAGLPPLKEVPAGGTSQTCSACGHRARENRPARSEFRCVACGFECDADLNAAAQIARRGAMTVSKGDRLVDLHKDMVAALRSRDDAGLGPLAGDTTSGFVAGRVSANSPNASGNALDPDELAGQNTHSRRSKRSQERSGRAGRAEISASSGRHSRASPECSPTSVGEGGNSKGESNTPSDREPAPSVGEGGNSKGESNHPHRCSARARVGEGGNSEGECDGRRVLITKSKAISVEPPSCLEPALLLGNGGGVTSLSVDGRLPASDRAQTLLLKLVVNRCRTRRRRLFRLSRKQNATDAFCEPSDERK